MAASAGTLSCLLLSALWAVWAGEEGAWAARPMTSYSACSPQEACQSVPDATPRGHNTAHVCRHLQIKMTARLTASGDTKGHQLCLSMHLQKAYR